MRSSDLERAISLLKEHDHTCVLVCGELLFTDDRRGILPVLELCERKGFEGFSAADRIVGKAAAMLYCLLGVKEVYADVMSREGRDMLFSHGIACTYAQLTDFIVNRRGDGLCPMEIAVRELSDPALAPAAIRAKLASLKGT